MKAHLTKIPPSAGEEFHDVEDAETYKKMLARDERRFRVADQDGDSMATREELTAFLHPEEFPHMRDIVIAVSEGPRGLLSTSHLLLGPGLLMSGPPSSAYLGGSSLLILQHLPQGTQPANRSVEGNLSFAQQLTSHCLITLGPALPFLCSHLELGRQPENASPRNALGNPNPGQTLSQPHTWSIYSEAISAGLCLLIPV